MKPIHSFLIAAALATSSIFALNGAARKPDIIARTPAAQTAHWVDSVYNSMTERQRVAQLFIPKLDIADNANSRALIKRLVESDGVGGILLGRSTIKGYGTLINYAQSLARVPLFITLDGEWGPSMRLKDAPKFPRNMCLGAIRNDSLLYAYGRETARQCRALGINVDFAPVLDVNSNPANPVIGDRSLGEDPARVASLGLAYSRGMEDGGVLSVAKHFPGHGDTSSDSHKTLPTVDHDRKRLESVDLLPFKSYISAGLSGIMVGHLNVPALDKSGTPSSLSSKITTDLLKKEMGFGGLVFTDALAMKGARSATNNCVLALNAGADMLLGSSSPTNDIDAVLAAIKAGKVKKSTVEDRVKKILAFKYAMGLTSRQSVDASGLEARVNAPQAEALINRLAAASITVVRNDASLLPIKNIAKRRIAVVNIGAKADNEFSRVCLKYASAATFGYTEGAITAADATRLRKDYDVVIAGVFSDLESARASMAALKECKELIPVFFINPYKMAKFAASVADSKTLVLAYENLPALESNAAQALFGGIAVDGRLPVNLKGIAKAGTGVRLAKIRLGYKSATAAGMSERLERKVDSLINRGVATGAFPGAQLLIAKGGDVIIDRAYGFTDNTKKTPVTEETIFDLASVSKATGTLSGLMKAYDKGLYKLDDKASKHIPGLRGTDKEDITVRELMFHESGMPPSLNMFTLMMDTATYTKPLTTSKPDASHSIKIANGVYGHDKAQLRRDLVRTERSDSFPIEIANGLWISPATTDTIMSRIYNASLGSKKYRYSCLNFCLLMDMEQRLTGKNHDQWVAEEIFEPLGATRTLYRPAGRIDADKIAATEKDTYLRRQTMRGYVHDELADFIGGVSGNAGLFANAGDLAKLCQMMLNDGEYGGETIISPETARLFTETVSPTCNRGLGYDKLWVEDGKTVSGAPTSTYGHTGFTGTCFWVDPDNDIIFIFLSNRVNPTRDNKAYNNLNIRNGLMTALYDEVNR